jgi:hypothetical protein
MRRTRNICRGFVCTFLLLAFSVPLFAGSMGVSEGHDLDELWADAQKQYDLPARDAILLLESRHVTILENGDLRTRVHRVVWIGTEIGIDSHADLRIPWNSAASTLDVVKLRTWRDGAWWPDESTVSETAVVETLPFALARADDYTTMRETMLLHDGVELPCIMETIYEIGERAGAQEGSDGLWVFAQRDPAVLVELTISLPAGTAVAFRSGKGAPEPEVSDDGGNMTSYAWKMENVDRLGSPRISNPAGYAPHVIWSTWRDWRTLGALIVSRFDGGAVLSGALADTLAGRLKHEPSPASKAHCIATLVDEWTRNIHYDSGFWAFSPRPASRTWETAYGHALDRAVLAAALFRAAGLETEPVYRSSGSSGFDQALPGLSRFEGIGVSVSGDRLQAFYDPAAGTLTDGPRPLYGRFLWRPGVDDAPAMHPGPAGSGGFSNFELMLTLAPSGEGDWSGTGFLETDGIFCAYDEMAGLRGEALAQIEEIVQSVLPGAHVDGFNPEIFDHDLVTIGFRLNMKIPEADDLGRIRVSIGEPAGGIASSLPPDVHLYQERRGSPVLLPGKMSQRIRLRLKTDGREVIHMPDARELGNEVGRFALSAEREDGWVTIDRALRLEAETVHPDAWPNLRALLLEEKDAAGRTILIK